MNLYSIYDAKTGQFLGSNKTSDQIAYLFGLKKATVQRAARKGSIVSEKYRIVIAEKNAAKIINCEDREDKDLEIIEDEELQDWKRKWDETTAMIRNCMRRKRVHNGKTLHKE